jgi:hypothetical protein
LLSLYSPDGAKPEQGSTLPNSFWFTALERYSQIQMPDGVRVLLLILCFLHTILSLLRLSAHVRIYNSPHFLRLIKEEENRKKQIVNPNGGPVTVTWRDRFVRFWANSENIFLVLYCMASFLSIFFPLTQIFSLLDSMIRFKIIRQVLNEIFFRQAEIISQTVRKFFLIH